MKYDIDLMLWHYGQGLLAVANSGSYKGDTDTLNKLASDRADTAVMIHKNSNLNFRLEFDYINGRFEVRKTPS